MRDFMCDLSERTLFFRCMVVRLCWHFCNFPWLCKVFLHIILQLGGYFLLGGHVLQPKGKEKHFCNPWKNRNILAAHFEAWKSFCSHFEGWKIILQSKWEFRSPFLKLGAFSHLKFFFALCTICLKTAIPSSFQIQIMHRLKLWIPDFLSFKFIYGMHNLSSRKCFKNVSNSSEIWCGSNISVQLCIVVFKRP